jgi:hypothetical protein
MSFLDFTAKDAKREVVRREGLLVTLQNLLVVGASHCVRGFRKAAFTITPSGYRPPRSARDKTYSYFNARNGSMFMARRAGM